GEGLPAQEQKRRERQRPGDRDRPPRPVGRVVGVRRERGQCGYPTAEDFVGVRGAVLEADRLLHRTRPDSRSERDSEPDQDENDPNGGSAARPSPQTANNRPSPRWRWCLPLPRSRTSSLFPSRITTTATARKKAPLRAPSAIT